jgi:hypothetical protein
MTTTQTTFDSASPDGATLDRAAFDGAKAEAFGGRIMSILTGSLLSSMVDIGHRTGLFAAATEGPATSEQLAARAGLCERYVREWLGAVTVGGIVEYDHATETFFLPPEHATLLTTPAGVGPLAAANTVLAGHLHQIVQVFPHAGRKPGQPDGACLLFDQHPALPDRLAGSRWRGHRVRLRRAAGAGHADRGRLRSG